MLEFFSIDSGIHIVFESPFSLEDREELSRLFSRKYNSFHIEFGKVYTIPLSILHLLHHQVSKNNRKINITTHTSRLNRYLSKLGFKTKFISLVKTYVKKTNAINVVLIGGSADSSFKIIEIIKAINLDNFSLIIVQHVEENRDGIFDAILQSYTSELVKYAQDGEKINKKCVYIAPKNRHLEVQDGYFVLSSAKKHNFSRPSISVSYTSFSNYYKESLLVIHECGYSNDGVDTLSLVKQNNSLIIIQKIEECKAKPMILNALNTGIYDYILSLKDIIRYLIFINKDTTREVWIEYLLYTIYEKYYQDFRFYHRDTISRRLNIFMIQHDLKDIKDAIGIILFNAIAFKGFFLQLSINVTEFFRYTSSLESLLECIHSSYKNTHHIKIWSAGCSSGEEIYSLAMLLDENHFLDKSILYATDFNHIVLEEAKNGVFPLKSLKETQANIIKSNLSIKLENYIIKNDMYFLVNEKIKKKIHFFHHNLATDSSFNEFDIIICTNVIIYFDENLQKKVFQLFYDSLKFGAYLVLGENEALINEFQDKFMKSSVNSNIFKKVN